jgi:hypothetical protein
MIKNASIRVGIKLKPCDSKCSVVRIESAGKEVVVQLPGEETQRVQVDMVHDANNTVESIYRNCQIHELMGRFVEGYNVTVITYGQTGSGKTFAFEGDANNPGIISESVRSVFANRTSNAILKCSFIQLYNERISDMLSRDSANDRGLKMRW